MSVDFVQEFCDHHHAYNGISELRARDQLRILRALEASIDGEVVEVTARDLERFLVSQDFAPGTVNKYLHMIRPFLKWLCRDGHITGESYLQLSEVKPPRGAEYDPRPYTRKEISAFWKDFDEHFPYTKDKDPSKRGAERGEHWTRRWQNGSSQWKRVYPYARRLQAEAIVALALYGGLRRDEIFRLKLEDMHYDNAWIRVVGARKNRAGKHRVRAVPMNKMLRLALGNWIEFRAQVLKPPHNGPWLRLWGARRLEPMKFSSFAHMLGDVGDGYSFHRMRHTYATEQVRAGMHVTDLQPILGQSDLSMTMRYVQKTEDDAVRAAEKTNDEFLAAVGRPGG